MKNECLKDFRSLEDGVSKLVCEFGSIEAGNMYSGDVDLDEIIEFKSKPVNADSLKSIQAHFGFLGVQAIKELHGEQNEELKTRKPEFKCELTVYGENGYTTSDLFEFVHGILCDLPSADGFKITTMYYGPRVEPWCAVSKYDETEEGPFEIDEIARTETFTYSLHQFLYNHGEGWTCKFENGKWINLEDSYNTAILDKDFGTDWWCWNLDLSVEFDFNKYPEILEALHNCVRKRIPHDEVKYCENAWAEGDVGILCSFISWYPRKLRVVQDFLDELNAILKPIMNECDGDGVDSKWYINEAPFAVATWVWTEEGFKVVGTEL